MARPWRFPVWGVAEIVIDVQHCVDDHTQAAESLRKPRAQCCNRQCSSGEPFSSGHQRFTLETIQAAGEPLRNTIRYADGKRELPEDEGEIEQAASNRTERHQCCKDVAEPPHPAAKPGAEARRQL